ncbi:BQ5605_C010g05882 [Microbotryum silenes-dioicae]|uniref:BQ5605_C010g05882 protein n=1 Tax=Microbotryum silenes-dioicae TaxID=796604 RepID=A0A2X0MB13_9BASI|nr:BQ5605_C010g05882 [Microbotryum silenes-dioicae]
MAQPSWNGLPRVEALEQNVGNSANSDVFQACIRLINTAHDSCSLAMPIARLLSLADGRDSGCPFRDGSCPDKRVAL